MRTEAVGEREDPRVTRSKACILDAALRILQAEGLAGLSVERVAAESGVAKTTIYRHWAGRAELTFAALETLMEFPTFSSSDSLRNDLISELNRVAAGLESSLWASVLPSMIAAAEHDQHVAELARTFAARRRAGLEQRLQRAVDQGEVEADADVGLLTSQVVAPLFYRRFMSRQPITEALISEHVDRLLRSV